MKRFLTCLIALYPSDWRRRYAKELEALIEDAGPRWTDAVDLLAGAITMRIRSPLAVLFLCAIAGATASGALGILLQRDVYESSAHLLVAGDGLQRTDASGLLVTLERALAPLGAGQRRRVSIEWNAALPGGEPVEPNQTVFRITATGSSPEAARRLAGGVIDRLQEAAGATRVVAPPSLPQQARLHVGLSPVLMTVGGFKNGLLAGFILMLIVPSLRMQAHGRYPREHLAD